MRRRVLFAISCIVLLASLGLSAQAVALVDPACDGDPYSNDLALHDMSLNWVDTNKAHAVAGITGSGIACGTDIESGGDHPGWETLNDNADIQIPGGVEVNPTTSMEVGAYVGSTKINAASWGVGIALIAQNQQAELSVDELSNCENENENTYGGPVEGTVITCYKGETTGLIPGHNWNWTTEGTDGSLTLTIGPFYNDLTGEPSGLTQVKDFTLCQYAGDVDGASCGDSSRPWMQKNGDNSMPNCRNGNGIYTATVTNKSGETSAPVDVCVKWSRLGVARAVDLNLPDVDRPSLPADPRIKPLEP